MLEFSRYQGIKRTNLEQTLFVKIVKGYMKKRDCIIKGLLFENKISIALLDCTQLVNVCIQKHNLAPLAASTIARVLLVASYLSASLKNEEDSCSITIKGDGLGGDIFVSGNQKLQLRGYITNGQVQTNENELDVSTCIGKNGTITVLYQDNGKPCMGTTNLVAGDVTEDFIAYFTQSEQRFTDMHLQVKLDSDGKCKVAYAICIQALPEVEQEQINQAIALMHTFYTLDTLFEDEDIVTIWERYVQTEKLSIKYPRYTCTCSKEGMQALLFALGREELESIIKEQGKIDIHCHYCNTDYIFFKEDIDNLYTK